MATHRKAGRVDPKHGTPRYRCRQQGCPNTYTDVLGGDNAFGRNYGGADCLPCYYAALLLSYSQTPEQIEQVPEFIGRFLPHLETMGWSWQDVKDSFTRKPVVM